jgi:hypothetical protein
MLLLQPETAQRFFLDLNNAKNMNSGFLFFMFPILSKGTAPFVNLHLFGCDIVLELGSLMV